MKEEKVIIFGREDLHYLHKDKDLNSIDLSCFRVALDTCMKTGVVMFIDDDGKTLILKNRYGIDGLVISKNSQSFNQKKIADGLLKTAQMIANSKQGNYIILPMEYIEGLADAAGVEFDEMVEEINNYAKHG